MVRLKSFSFYCCTGESWFTRSIFVVEGYMLVCIENLVQFGSSIDDCGLTCPYYSLDSCCAIQDILEMVSDLVILFLVKFNIFMPFSNQQFYWYHLVQRIQLFCDMQTDCMLSDQQFFILSFQFVLEKLL